MHMKFSFRVAKFRTCLKTEYDAIFVFSSMVLTSNYSLKADTLWILYTYENLIENFKIKYTSFELISKWSNSVLQTGMTLITVSAKHAKMDWKEWVHQFFFTVLCIFYTSTVVVSMCIGFEDELRISKTKEISFTVMVSFTSTYHRHCFMHSTYSIKTDARMQNAVWSAKK